MFARRVGPWSRAASISPQAAIRETQRDHDPHRLWFWIAGAVSLIVVSIVPEVLAAQACAGPYCVTVNAQGGSQTRPANSGGHTATFTVRNTGTANDDYMFDCLRSGPVNCGPVSPVFLNLNPNQSANVTITYSVNGAGSGTIGLRALSTNDFMASDQDNINVTVTAPPAAASVTPNGATTPDRETGTGLYNASFTVKNTGGTTGTFSFSCDQSGANVTCAGTNPSSASIGPGATRTVTASYGVGSVGLGTLEFEAQVGGSIDIGWYNVPVHSYGVAVTPDGAWAPSRHKNTSGYSATFTVENTGSKGNTFTISCPPASGLTCTGTSDTSLFVAAHSEEDVVAYYNVGSSTGTKTLTLSAASTSGPPRSNSGSFKVPVVNGAVAATPDGEFTPARHTDTDGNQAVFKVKNTGPLHNTFSIDCSGSDGISCAETDIASAPLDSGDSVNVVATYSTSESPGEGRLRLIVSGAGGAGNEGTFRVPMVDGVVAVTPDGDSTPPRHIGTGDYQVQFTIRNNGALENTFDLTCAPSANVTCQGIPESVTLGSDSSTNVAAMYSVAATAGTGTLVVRASGSGAALDSGFVSIPIDTLHPRAPIVSVDDVNPGTTVERSGCLTFATGPGAAVECGALRIVHPLPAITTMGKTHAPYLLFNSELAHPLPIAAALVGLPIDGMTPDSVEAILMVDGFDTTRVSWPGSSWSAGQTYRVAVQYDAYQQSPSQVLWDYTLEVATWFDGQRLPVTASGQLAVLNRKWAWFGNGWWLSGLERLFFQSGKIIWTGGDGSIRVYEPDGSNLWRAPNLTRPDSIVWNASLNRYLRRLPDGRQIRFSSSGWHYETVSRHGAVTSFTYGTISSGSWRLLNIKLPLRSGQLTAYEFYYDVANPLHARMDSVVARDLDGGRRVTKIEHLNMTRIGSITDPDGEAVTFNAYGVAYNHIRERVGRNGHTVRFDFDGRRVASAHAYPGIGVPDTIVTRFRPAEILGLAEPIDTAAAYAMVDGPRTAVGDSTRFKVDRYGQVTEIVDALGNVKQIERGNTTFPGLVTRTEHPNGWVQSATYDAHGHLLSSSDSSASPVATTSYDWDHNWSAITKIKPPMGDSTVYGIDSNNGNRLWVQDARGASSRTNFQYDSSDPALLTRIIGPVDDTTTVDHDALGNVHQVTTPLGFVTEYFKDGLGRDTLIVSPIDGAHSSRQRIVYDVMGRVDSTINTGPSIAYQLSVSRTLPAESLIVNTDYDDAGNPILVERRAYPDTAGLSTETTSMLYDAVGRLIRTTNPMSKDTTVYDAAGNVVVAGRLGGPLVTMSYDPLNRLEQRIVPKVDYGTTSCALHLNLPASCDLKIPNWNMHTSNGIRIPADTATFTFDAVGNMLTANNRYARITRTYNPNGTMSSEEQWLRRYGVESFSVSHHKYLMDYRYDLNGRRDTLIHPVGLAPVVSSQSKKMQAYGYSSWGALEYVRNVLGNQYTFEYDNAGRLVELDLPGSGAYEERIYDRDGRLDMRTLFLPSPLGVARQESYTYDRRGKVMEVDFTGHVGLKHEGSMVYSALGNLGASDFSAPQSSNRQHFQLDGHGNAVWTRTETTQGPIIYDKTYVSGSRLTRQFRRKLPGQTLYDGWDPDTSYTEYVRGNVRYDGQRQYACAGGPPLGGGGCTTGEEMGLRASTSYYGADQKLMFHQRNQDTLRVEGGIWQLRERRGAFEEYWYDALGRRILVRTRSDDPTNLCDAPAGEPACVSSVSRFIWDGDQILYETRFNGLDTQPGASGTAQFGWLGYTHGPGIDAPLDLIRMDYEGSSAPLTLIPHANWRGHYDFMTDTTGAQFGCVPVPTTGCDELALPGSRFRAFLDVASRQLPERWFGSLVQDQQDRSGLMYRRNRYYDPASGRFTQQDPIGLAGGLNLYGFANGDPVNFSDPFGLSPCDAAEKATVWCLLSLLFNAVKDRIVHPERGVDPPGVYSEPESVDPGTSVTDPSRTPEIPINRERRQRLQDNPGGVNENSFGINPPKPQIRKGNYWLPRIGLFILAPTVCTSIPQVCGFDQGVPTALNTLTDPTPPDPAKEVELRLVSEPGGLVALAGEESANAPRRGYLPGD